MFLVRESVASCAACVCRLESQLAYFRWAAEKGHAASLERIGAMYAEGRGVKQDQKAARAYFLRAAQRGRPDSWDRARNQAGGGAAQKPRVDPTSAVDDARIALSRIVTTFLAKCRDAGFLAVCLIPPYFLIVILATCRVMVLLSFFGVYVTVIGSFVLYCGRPAITVVLSRIVAKCRDAEVRREAECHHEGVFFYD